ncbi:MAG: response regulator transcription factor [Chloroflexi bacterium]|nr:response regulator transcription factor [Chloroflexota bacterium]
MQKHILIVDDDDLLRRSLAFNLEKNGFRTSTASTAEDALAIIEANAPDLVVLDIGLPGMDGLDALKVIQGNYNLPVIFLTARRRELDELLGLELGADDYVTKPFELEILLARIKAVLRRTQRGQNFPAPKEKISAGDLVIDPLSHTVEQGGKPVVLSPREFDLLYTLARAPGEVVTTADLITRVWGPGFVGEPQVLYVHIRWLREKIETNPDSPQHILTVRGVGYKFVPQEV